MAGHGPVLHIGGTVTDGDHVLDPFQPLTWFAAWLPQGPPGP
jgi:hypothetical protein